MNVYRFYRGNTRIGAGMAYALTLLLFLALSLPAADPAPRAERRQFADGLYARGLHDLAVREYESYLKDFPGVEGQDIVYFRMAECYRHLGKLSSAEKAYEQVYRILPAGPHRLKAGFRLADIFHESGRTDEAIQTLDQILQASPPDDIASASLYSLGAIQLKAGEPARAIPFFDKIRTSHAQSDFYAPALLQLGLIYGTGKTPEATDGDRKALDSYRLALERPGSDRIAAESLFQTAEIHFRNKTFDLSAEAYRRLLKEYPSDPRAVEAGLQSGWAMHNAGLYAEALVRADQALKAGESAGQAESALAEWLYLKANCERQLMRGAEATATYAKLLSRYPKSPFAAAARYEKALTYYRMGQYKETIAEISKVDLGAGLKKDVYWILAESYAAIGDQNSAIQYYRLLTRDFPTSDVACDALYRLAYQLQSRGSWREAATHYGELVKAFPKSELAPRSLFASAVCLAREKMDAEAARDWGALILQYPAHSLAEESFYQKAMAEARLKRDAEALESLQELLKRFPATRFAGDALYWRGVILQESGRTQDAEVALREALKKTPGSELKREVEYALALTLKKAGKPDEAVKLLSALLSSPMRERFAPELMQWLSEHAFAGKDFKLAIEAARVLAEWPRDPAWKQTGWGLMGRSYLALQDKKNAEESFKKSLAIKGVTTPLAPESAWRLGELAQASADYRGALDYFRQAAELASSDELLGIRARAYAGLGKASSALKDREGAARYFMSVAVLYDDQELVPECLYEAALLFRDLGNQEAAEKAERELRERYPKSDWAKKLTPAE